MNTNKNCTPQQRNRCESFTLSLVPDVIHEAQRKLLGSP